MAFLAISVFRPANRQGALNQEKTRKASEKYQGPSVFFFVQLLQRGEELLRRGITVLFCEVEKRLYQRL